MKLLILLFCLTINLYGQANEEYLQHSPEYDTFGGFNSQQFSRPKNLGLCLIRAVTIHTDVFEAWPNYAKEVFKRKDLLVIANLTANRIISMEPLDKQKFEEVSDFPNKNEIMFRCTRLLSCGFMNEINSISLFNVCTTTGTRMLIFRYTYLGDTYMGPVEKEDWLFFKY